MKREHKEETTKLLDINEAVDRVAMDTKEASTENSRVVSSMDVTEKNTETKRKTIEDTTEEPGTTKETESVKPAAVKPSELHFSSKDKMLWPIDGEVILEYNMKNTVYFKTLNQYKCSPAIAIQSELNTEVHSATDGKISEIGTNEEIGNYVKVTLGDGYELTYGQLKDIQVEQGEVINKKELIGYINNPTKYYTLEGTNLYLKLTVDGKPQDPLDYLNY